MLQYITDRTTGWVPCRYAVCMVGDTLQAEVLLCLLFPQPTDTKAPQPATLLYTHPHDSIYILTRHFSGMHFNTILHRMRISSKWHITLKCSGQNVRDFQFRNACYILHPSLLSHIFTSRSINSPWRLQSEKGFSLNFVKLSFPCLLYIRPSAAAPRSKILPLRQQSTCHSHKKQHVELQINADTVLRNKQGSSPTPVSLCSSHHLLHCSCLSSDLESHTTAIRSMATVRFQTRRHAEWAVGPNWTLNSGQCHASQSVVAHGTLKRYRTYCGTPTGPQ